MATMKAVRIHAYGGSDVLTYEDAPRPVPGEGDVLVHVHAAAINPVDWKIRQGYLAKMLQFPLPMIPGWDFSGVVAEIGPGVTGFAKGDAVYARPDISRDGAYAEYIAARASAVAKKPASIDHVHAAAVPLAALTAWQSLFDEAKLEAGQTVLIHAAAGGVGSFAVQLAHWKGARVLGTASARNADFVRDLGADVVIDYTKERFEDVARDVDVVFDTIGGETQERSWAVLKQGGVLVSITTRPDPAGKNGARGAYVFVQPNAEELHQLAELIDAGKVRPIVDKVLPLSAAREAHDLSQTGHVRGKIVLQIVP